MNATPMLSIKPYLIKAYYEWIIDSGCTPYVLIQANLPHVQVPAQYIDPEDETIVFNIDPQAVQNLDWQKNKLIFQASINTIIHYISIPYYAIIEIFAEENEEGARFAIDPKEVEKISVLLSDSSDKKEKKPGSKTQLPPYLRILRPDSSEDSNS